MSDIFISYAREDRPAAETLAHALEVQGWSVWWDRNIPIGGNPDEVIQAALTAARCVIVLWSSVSAESRWVRNEAEEGAARDVLFPVLIEKDVRIPLAFRGIQAADLVGWDGGVAAASFRSLLADITQQLEAEGRRRGEGEGKRPSQAAAQRRAEDEDRWRREAEAQREALAVAASARNRFRRRALWFRGSAVAIVIGVGATIGGVLLNKRDAPLLPAARPTAELSADPVAIRLGQAATLTWTTTNANDVRLEPDLGTVSAQGSRQVSPQQLATYRLVASGPGGTVENTVRVEVRAVGPPPPADLARGKAVTASRAESTHPPANVVDGDPGTIWNAGVHPDPIPQWVEINLGRPSTIMRLRFTVHQAPPGETVHTVLGRSYPGGEYRILHVFRGTTADAQVLEYSAGRCLGER